ncbi:uncharacterized protein LOC132197111 [Neocloeon triangulifer]|uniref:uncharacterized protein LOC132197111 n=1 Tax=Neocloeon triangulifer TaxID=2078957 RepID=UPI00286F3D00|nr:uncharacterized protein LOC132197111 [Neocloeon triangulifer]
METLGRVKSKSSRGPKLDAGGKIAVVNHDHSYSKNAEKAMSTDIKMESSELLDNSVNIDCDLKVADQHLRRDEPDIDQNEENFERKDENLSRTFKRMNSQDSPTPRKKRLQVNSEEQSHKGINSSDEKKAQSDNYEQLTRAELIKLLLLRDKQIKALTIRNNILKRKGELWSAMARENVQLINKIKELNDLLRHLEEVNKYKYKLNVINLA